MPGAPAEDDYTKDIFYIETEEGVFVAEAEKDPPGCPLVALAIGFLFTVLTGAVHILS